MAWGLVGQRETQNVLVMKHSGQGRSLRSVRIRNFLLFPQGQHRGQAVQSLSEGRAGPGLALALIPTQSQEPAVTFSGLLVEFITKTSNY